MSSSYQAPSWLPTDNGGREFYDPKPFTPLPSGAPARVLESEAFPLPSRYYHSEGPAPSRFTQRPSRSAGYIASRDPLSLSLAVSLCVSLCVCVFVGLCYCNKAILMR